jgi:hypothetical protein
MEAMGRTGEGIRAMKRIFPRGTRPDAMASVVARMVSNLDPLKTWAVEVTEWKKPRTAQQNKFLWGVVYPSILEGGGEALRGWQRDDLHDYFLGECFGWETLEGFGRKRMRPLKRSSALDKQEFSDYLLFLETKCLDMGIVIPEPSYETA